MVMTPIKHFDSFNVPRQIDKQIALLQIFGKLLVVIFFGDFINDIMDADCSARIQAESIVESLAAKLRQKMGGITESPPLPPSNDSFSEIK